ncbi:hypothetical protein APS_0703 [Acetobacter pasteurianus subsp. pasteurianus LMG 1262 = NBRC 106471]|nr:hypothetical protein APS_0703 [Acetobacter pasteurianus subsp. pasteurianus LMG 1262 = NBRC 106471]
MWLAAAVWNGCFLPVLKGRACAQGANTPVLSARATKGWHRVLYKKKPAPEYGAG